MPTAMDGKDSKRTAIVMIIVVVIIILIVALLLGGVEGIFGVIKFFTIGIMIVTFLGFVVYIIWYLFFKQHKRHIPWENRQGYVNSALDNGADMMEDLVLTGDKNHSSKRFMTIQGYLRILAFDGNEYDMFIGKRSPSNPFEEHKVVMLKPSTHSDLLGDVFVYGVSLISKYGYYFLNTDLLEFKMIDQHVAMDTFRTITYETLGDMKAINDRMIGFDEAYLKQRNQDKLLKIPQLAGQQNNNQPPQ